jgi:hypothetical protein
MPPSSLLPVTTTWIKLASRKTLRQSFKASGWEPDQHVDKLWISAVTPASASTGEFGPEFN